MHKLIVPIAPLPRPTNGTKLVFLLGAPTGPHSFEKGIATANADGSDVEHVTETPTFDHQADWGTHPVTNIEEQ